MACLYVCFSVFLLLIGYKMLVYCRFVDNLYQAPLALDCFDGITIPDEPTDTTFSRDVERSVLQELYIETGGYNWTIQRGWNQSRQSTTDQCKWAGVKCRDGYVIGLTLNANNLLGKIPNSLWKLRNLRVFCLSGNELYGELKDFIFPNMTRLLRLDVAFCYLSGNLPEILFSSLKALQKIQLCCQRSPSKFRDQIPRSISNLTNLRVLSLGENSLYGLIPDDIGKLTNVWFLDLEFMPDLSGDIKIFLGMKSLKYMHLSDAGVQGQFPDDFGEHFPHLEELKLPQNPGINGPIPSSIDKMINLTTIVIHCNSLQGTIPKQIGKLLRLRILDLSNNKFENIASELTFKSASKLEKLSVGNNKYLSGDIEKLITSLSFTGSQLRVLNVSNCDFYGNLIPAIWDLQNLIAIDLKHNRIGGTIPDVHNDLMFLYNLDISHNKFQGKLPETFKLLQSLMYLDIRGNSKMRAPGNKVNVTSGDIQSFMRVSSIFSSKSATYTCPFARLTATNGSVFLDEGYYGYVFCVCKDGYYGFLAQCNQCMTNGECNSNPERIDSLNDNHVPQITMTIKRGYWPSPSVDNVTHLIECPSLPSEKDKTCNPNGDCQCWLNITSHTTVCNSSCICHDGCTNRLCSMCIDGYFSSGSLCVKCPTSSMDTDWYIFIPVLAGSLLVMWMISQYLCSNRIKVRLIVAFVELVFLVILRLLKIIAGWFLEISMVLLLFYVVGITQDTRGIVSILVFYIQVLDAIISASNVALPEFVLSVQHYMNSVMNLDFTGMSCKFPVLFTPLGNYLLVFLFPIACLLLIWMVYGIRALLHCFRNDDSNDDPLRDFRCSCKKVSISCLCLTFFPVSKQTISILAPCESDGTSSYMRVAPWVQCCEDDDIYTMLQLLGWLGVVLYVIGVPIVLQSFLLWYKWNRDKFNDENKAICESWLGAIYLPYKESVHWYFEVLKLSRKLCIAVFLAAFPHTSSIQTLTVSIVLIVSLIYQLKCEPYEDHGNGRSFENFLEVVVLAVLNQSCVLLRFASYDSNESQEIIWTVIVLNLGVIVAFMVAIPSLLLNVWCNHDSQEERQPFLQNNPVGSRA